MIPKDGESGQHGSEPLVLGVELYILNIAGDLARMVFSETNALHLFMGLPWQSLADVQDLNLAELIADADSRQVAMLATPKSKKADRLRLAGEHREARIVAATAACVLAGRAVRDGHERMAWNYAMAAQDMRAVLRTMSVVASGGPRTASSVGTSAADATHVENRALKAQGLAWFEANKAKFKSLNKAAEAMTTVVPVKYSTAREWLKGMSL